MYRVAHNGTHEEHKGSRTPGIWWESTETAQETHEKCAKERMEKPTADVGRFEGGGGGGGAVELHRVAFSGTQREVGRGEVWAQKEHCAGKYKEMQGRYMGNVRDNE